MPSEASSTGVLVRVRLVRSRPGVVESELMTSWPSVRWVACGLAMMGVFALVGCSTASPTSASTSTTVASKGWKIYGYGRVTISAPASWKVRREDGCPEADVPGALVLGVPPGYSCPAFQGPPGGAVVAVSDLPPEEVDTLPPPEHQARVHVHGLVVETGSYPSGQTVWLVPSASVQLTGRGPGSVAVMRTLRPA
jgi:hypothetical protein